jgi:hypothetical protein
VRDLRHHDGLDLESSDVGAELFSALATADYTTLLIMLRGLLVRELRAGSRRVGDRQTAHLVGDQTAFWREMRALRRMAFASMVISLLARLLVAAVTLEGTGQGELAELVANHVLVDQHRDVVLAVVDRRW